jgi:hypothetical protein
MTAPPITSATLPVTKERVRECLKSATFWAEKLPLQADHFQHKADTWAIASGMLSVLTSLTIWVTLIESSTWYAQAIATAAAILAGAASLVPRIEKFGERSGEARALGTRYGAIKGRLIDLEAVVDQPKYGEVARELVGEFEKIKSAKDQLPGLTAERTHDG